MEDVRILHSGAAATLSIKDMVTLWHANAAEPIISYDPRLAGGLAEVPQSRIEINEASRSVKPEMVLSRTPSLDGYWQPVPVARTTSTNIGLPAPGAGI